MSSKKNNSIKGGKNDDVLVGSLDADSIEGKDGDDTLSGLAGRDVIDGGKGDDSIDGGADGDLLAGGKGDDQIRGGAGDDLLFGDGSIKGSGHGWASGKASGAGSGKDTGKDTGKDSGKHGGKGSKPEWDKWVSNQGTGTGKGSKKGSKASGSGGNGDDYLDGGAGSDQLFAGGGSDIGNYQLAENLTSLDAYDGGDGVDTLRLNLTLADLQDADFQGDLEDYLQFLDEHTNAASGEADSATYQFNAFGLEASGWEKLEVSLAGSAGGNVTYAGDSEEPVTVDAGDENDTVIGGQAGDDINGGGGSDIILGGGGDDVIDAGEGDDLVVWESGDGNDVVDGGAGFDALDLTLDDEVPTTLAVSADAEGNVILIAEDGSILTVDGVEDIVINAGVAGSAVTIGDLTGTDIAQDTLYFVGAAGDDELDAHLTDRRINAQGNGGNDTLLSGSGNDILDGGEGDDSLDAGGGSGADVIYGGDGDDTIFATLGDEQNSNAIDLVDGGADNDQLNVTFVEPTPHDLLLKVQSNGDGSFSVTSEDIDVDENLHVTNVENLNLIAGEAALHFELGSLADTTLAGNGVNFEGSAEADFFDGSDTDVTLNLHGNSGADTLIGGSENDQLAGGAEDDSLSGSGGDDNLVGGEGNDILDGGQGHDVADYSSASAGVAVDLSIFMAQDTLGAGSDTLANIEEVTGSAFADTLSASNFGSNLNGGMGEDQLNGGDGFDFLSGGDGDDILVDTNSGLLSGDAGNDFIDGMANYHPDGSGVRVNYSDQDVDVTGDGSVIVTARTALDSYGDTDTFGAAAHNVQTSDYSDHVTGSDQDNYVLLRAGDDQAFGLDGDDFFKGGSGNDAIDGGAGFDFVSYEEDGYDGNGAPTQGVDVDLAINQAIDGFNDIDSLTNVEGIIGSALDDVIAGDSGANKLFARGGNDIVSGREGNDTLGGWSGDDSLDGGSGDDTLLGDTGNDTLTGGSGADLYLFNSPSNGATDFGHDTITDFSVTEDTLDLSLFELTNLDELKAVATDDGIDTTITIDGNRSILLQAVTLTQLSDSNFIFAEAPNPGLTGSEDDDVLTGTAGDDSIAGLGGSDVLIGLQGNDILDGGEGTDEADYSQDGAGVSVDLSTGTATDGAGDTDTLISIENVRGSAFADTITGDDAGNILWGDPSGVEGGADTISAGGGDDSIISGPEIDVIDGGSGLDVLYLSSDGINFGETGVTVTFNSDSSISSFNASSGQTENDITGIEAIFGSLGHDQITGNDDDNILSGWYGNNQLDGGAGIDTAFFSFSPAITVDLGAGMAVRENVGDGIDQLSNIENVIGSPEDDLLIGDNGNNILEGVDGNDLLRGGAGNDTLNGGASSIISYLGNPDNEDNDTVDFSTDPAAVTVDLALGTALDGYGDTDTLLSIESINGSEHADTLSGDDNDNSITGLAGDDLLSGGAGADTYVLTDDGYDNPVFGHDTVTDFSVAEDIINVRAFGTVSSMGDLVLNQDNADTVIVFDGSNSLRLSNVTATDLTAVNFDFIEHLVISGTPDDDVLEGGDGNDQIAGLAGNDQLFGRDGDDYIDGGADSDYIEGGNGHDNLNGGSGWDDLYGNAGDDIINTGADGGYASGGTGNDTITGVNNDWDHLDGGAGDDILIDPDGSGFVVGGPGNDTLDGLLGYEEDPKGVYVNLDSADWDVSGDASLVLAARTALDGYGDTDTLAAGAISAHASYFDDYIRGSEFSQYFFLRAGDDTAYGLDGDDSFYPGSGADFVDGGDGWDNINYFDDGYDNGGSSVSVQGAVVNLSGVDFDYGSGTAMANKAIDTFGDTDTIFNIEAVDGSALDDIIVGTDEHNWLQGNEGNDKLFGGGTGDNLVGGPGDDLLDGGDGEWDTAWYNSWPGEDHGIDVNLADGMAYDDGFGNVDTLVSIENVEGSEYADTIVGDDQPNWFAGNGGNDILHGGGGDDSFGDREGDDQSYGEGGNDWFDASPGSDLLDGGSDYDTINYDSYTGTTSGISLDMGNTVDAGGYTNVVLVSGDGFGNTDYIRDIESIRGTDFNDSITGSNDNNEFNGAAGNDTLVGGGGDDSLSGEDDFDILDGGAGYDYLDGGENDDTLTGGSEGDVFRFNRYTNQGDLTSFGSDIITDFTVGEDSLDLYSVPEISSYGALLELASEDVPGVVVIAFESEFAGVLELNSITLQGISLTDLPNMDIWFSPIMGTEGDDVLIGSSFDEQLQGLGGDDTLNGLGGNDWLQGGPGTDTLDGGEGNDSAVYRWFDETMGITVDLAANSASNDGFGDSDTLLNIENVEGSEFDDSITGNDQDNSLQGHEGNDLIYGREGGDWLDGGVGDDQLFGETGFDSFPAGPGNDLFDGGADSDHLNYDSWTGTSGGVQVDFSNIEASAGGYSDVVVVADDGMGFTDYLRNIENITGTDFADSLTGDEQDNHLGGNEGDDVISGKGGNDFMHGDAGLDILNGGAGNDHLIGGEGSDTFIFGVLAGQDYIEDFEVGVDALQLEAGVAIAGLSDDGTSTYVDLGSDGDITLEGVIVTDPGLLF